MRNFSALSGILVALLAPSISMADYALPTINAYDGSASGTQINVTYSIDDSTSPLVYETWLDYVTVQLSNSGKSSTVVVIATCGGIGRDPFTVSISCSTLGADNLYHVDSTCTTAAAPLEEEARQVIAGELPSLLNTSSYQDGETEDCTYQLAVVRDGRWLQLSQTNSSHNFNLAF